MRSSDISLGNRKVLFNTKYSNSKEYIGYYLMIIPQFIGFLIFALYPILWVFRFALYNYDGITSTYIGLDNFIRAFARDADYWLSLWNTVILAFGKLVVEIPLSLICAIILNSKIKGRDFFRTCFFLPNVISVAIIGLIFYFMFATFEGVVNNVMLALKLIPAPINWFGSKWTAMFVLAVASIWQGFGINMLFFLSALQNIPKELYECAEIDGAGKLVQFFRITLPMIGQSMQIIILLAIIGSMKVADLVLVLTNGQPGGQTEVVMTYIFKYFFNYSSGAPIAQIGYASALGVITALFLLVLTGIYLMTTKKMNNQIN